MDFNRLTLKSQEAIAAAQELGRRRGNPEIHPEHLLLALLIENPLALCLLEHEFEEGDTVRVDVEDGELAFAKAPAAEPAAA